MDNDLAIITVRLEAHPPMFFHAVTSDVAPFEFITTCAMGHDKPVDWRDCPVASNWVLVRAS